MSRRELRSQHQDSNDLCSHGQPRAKREDHAAQTLNTPFSEAARLNRMARDFVGEPLSAGSITRSDEKSRIVG